MDYAAIIQYLYPDANLLPGGDVELERVWDGRKWSILIRHWLRPEPKPTIAELEAAWVEVEPVVLARIKRRVALAIDEQAEAIRLRFISPGAGMAGVYRQKQTEAERWVREVIHNLDDYPLLKARANRLGVSPDTVAAEWNAKAAAWITAAAGIEDVREDAKERIEAAGDLAAVEAILAAVVWE